jgi:TolB-like protein
VAIRFITLAAILVSLVSLACTPRAMRGGEGTENPGMDRAAMSTQLDKADIDYLVKRNLEMMYQSRFWTNDVQGASSPPVMAIWPIENATSEHLEDQMLTLLSSIETSFVNGGEVQVVSRSRQESLAKEIGIQQTASYDPTAAQQLGRQLGARYFVTGKLTAVDERLQNTRRLQYSLFLQVLEIETSLVKFQYESARSKALKK